MVSESNFSDAVPPEGHGRPVPSEPGPPYGVPQSVQPPIPAPIKQRPSGWWFVLGGGLLAAGIVIFSSLMLFVVLRSVRTDVSVAADGTPHAVTVDSDQSQLVWAREGRNSDCSIIDRTTGAEVARSGLGATSYTKGSYYGEYVFASGSGQLEITCNRSGSDILIGPEPSAALLVGGILGAIGSLLVLGLGVAVLIVTAIRFAKRPPAPRT